MKFIWFIIIFSVLIIGLASGLECSVKTSCSVDETELISMYNPTNSHAAQPGYYNYKLCCTNLTSQIRTTACLSNETGLLALYSLNNSHVERYGLGNYNYNVCISSSTQLTCFYDNFIPEGTTCLYSMAQTTNSHIGNCSTYTTKFLCFPGAGSRITLSGRVLDSKTGEPLQNAEVKITIVEKGETFSTTTDDKGFFEITFYSEIRQDTTYTLSISAVDSKGRYSYIVRKFRK